MEPTLEHVLEYEINRHTGRGDLKAAAVFTLNEEVLCQSDDFNLTPDEVKKFNADEEFLYQTGLYLGGVKYILVRYQFNDYENPFMALRIARQSDDGPCMACIYKSKNPAVFTICIGKSTTAGGVVNNAAWHLHDDIIKTYYLFLGSQPVTFASMKLTLEREMNQLIGRGDTKAAAGFTLNGEVLCQSDDFNLTPAEVKKFNADEEFLYQTGLYLRGVKYILVRYQLNDYENPFMALRIARQSDDGPCMACIYKSEDPAVFTICIGKSTTAGGVVNNAAWDLHHAIVRVYKGYLGYLAR